MLIVKSSDHFRRVCAFAKAKGPLYEAWLWDRLWYLHTFADRGDKTPDSREGYGFSNCTCDDCLLPPAWPDLVNRKVGVELMYDGAAASFYWIAKRLPGGETMMNGGLIYHGDQTGWREDGQYTDPFSVELCRNPGDNVWSIHT
jgi:hypothetical protein